MKSRRNHRCRIPRAVILVAGLSGIASAARADLAVAWGYNSNGQLGNGSSGTASTFPVAVNGLSSGITGVAAGQYFSMAIQNGGAVAWGLNGNGQLGNGTTVSSLTPAAVAGLSTGVSTLAAGAGFSLAIQNGAAKSWGGDHDGELGTGTYTAGSATPVAVFGLTSGVTAIAGGGLHALAIQNGAAKAWGYNGNGQLGNGSSAGSPTPGTVLSLTSGVTAIAAGKEFSLAIQNGGAKAWGYNSDGELGTGTTLGSASPIVVSGLSSGVTAVAAGAFHGLAIQNGNVYAWGSNGGGQLGVSSITTGSNTPLLALDTAANFVSVAATYDSSFALSSDGSLWVWGDNSRGQLGLGTTTTQFNAPQHLLAPAGYAFTRIDGDSVGDHVVATLATTATLGDVNGDGKVNIADLGLLATNYGKSGANLPGDINLDGKVDIADLGILATHYGLGGSGSELPFAQTLASVGLPAVPEPTSFALLVISGVMFPRRRSR